MKSSIQHTLMGKSESKSLKFNKLPPKFDHFKRLFEKLYGDISNSIDEKKSTKDTDSDDENELKEELEAISKINKSATKKSKSKDEEKNLEDKGKKEPMIIPDEKVMYFLANCLEAECKENPEIFKNSAEEYWNQMSRKARKQFLNLLENPDLLAENRL